MFFSAAARGTFVLRQMWDQLIRINSTYVNARDRTEKKLTVTCSPPASLPPFPPVRLPSHQPDHLCPLDRPLSPQSCPPAQSPPPTSLTPMADLVVCQVAAAEVRMLTSTQHFLIWAKLHVPLAQLQKNQSLCQFIPAVGAALKSPNEACVLQGLECRSSSCQSDHLSITQQ